MKLYTDVSFANIQNILRISLLFILILAVKISHSQTPVPLVEKYANGQIKMKGKSIGDKRVGYWYYYDSSGWLQRKEKWSKGEFIWSVEFNEKHKRTRGTNKKGETIIYKGCNCSN